MSTSLDGVINLFKPAGLLSARYAYRLRPILGEKRVGHAGTLDPFADGVLVVCLGKATKLVERLMGLPKTYAATLRLGITNATFDPEHEFEPVPGAADPGRPAVERALAAMTGEIEQTPPDYSAVKIQGKPAYLRARRAAARKEPTAPLAIKPRPVRIDAIEIVDYRWPELQIVIRCGRGTYIRAIARDLGTSLRCGAVCTALRRSAVGPFTIENATDLRNAPRETVRAAVLPIDAALHLLG